MTMTAFPAVGALTPFSGVVSGLVNPAAYVAVLYLRDAGGVNWVSVCLDVYMRIKNGLQLT